LNIKPIQIIIIININAMAIYILVHDYYWLIVFCLLLSINSEKIN
jgi:hypothetical protein